MPPAIVLKSDRRLLTVERDVRMSEMQKRPIGFRGRASSSAATPSSARSIQRNARNVRNERNGRNDRFYYCVSAVASAAFVTYFLAFAAYVACVASRLMRWRVTGLRGRLISLHATDGFHETRRAARLINLYAVRRYDTNHSRAISYTPNNSCSAAGCYSIHVWMMSVQTDGRCRLSCRSWVFCDYRVQEKGREYFVLRSPYRSRSVE